MMLVIYYLHEPNSTFSPYAYFCRETYLSVLIQMAQTHSRLWPIEIRVLRYMSVLSMYFYFAANLYITRCLSPIQACHSPVVIVQKLILIHQDTFVIYQDRQRTTL